jgi:myosin heavy subunit
MTRLNNVDLVKGTVEVAEYSATTAALALLKEKYAVVPDANTTEGYALVKAGIKELTGLRTSLEAARKREKAPHLQAGKIIDDEAKRITDELVALEDPMKAAKKEVDDRVERERQERIARLQQKVDAIKAMPGQVRGKDSTAIAEMIDRCGEIDASHDFFDLTQEARAAQQAAMDELTQMLTDRLAFEQAERQRNELAAQLAEQQEKMRRQQEEMDRQREEMARQQQELDRQRQQFAPTAEIAAEPAPAASEPASNSAPSRPAPTLQLRARVVDKSAFIAAIADGLATEDLLIIDRPALDSLANDKGQSLNLPGVIVEPVPARAA